MQGTLFGGGRIAEKQDFKKDNSVKYGFYIWLFAIIAMPQRGTSSCSVKKSK